jgi:hypothetical protein
MVIFRYVAISLSNARSILDTPLIKSGTKFGGTGGGSFDDSSMRNFTPLHYLRGMITRCDTIPLAWCQFLYSSPDNSENILESDVHGTRSTSDVIERFVLTRNERINEVQVVVDNEIILINGIEQSVPLIRGVRLFTTEGRQSQSIDHIEGERFTEKFDGHAVRYVTGRKGLYIDQLQFHWVPSEFAFNV